MVIHIPKTAGFSLSKILRNKDARFNTIIQPASDGSNLRLIHCSIFEAVDMIHRIPKHIFAIVRNPYTRFVSCFVQAKIHGFHHEILSSYAALGFCKMYFDLPKDNEFWKTELGLFFLPQVHFIQHNPGSSDVTVGKLESLQKDVTSFLTSHGYDDQHIIENDSPLAINKMRWYDEQPALKYFIETFYSADFKRFKYNTL